MSDLTPDDGIHATPATIFVNASIGDLGYRAANPAIVIDLPRA
jgi:hypothetical protein